MQKKYLISLIIIIAIVVGLWYFNKKEAEAPGETPTPVVSNYKDGTYSATGTYQSPAGKEEIGITVTISNNIITDTTFTPKATNEVSIKLQKMFADGYKAVVVGRTLDEAKLDKVSGSSLTPKGWNDAIEKIKLEAQA